MGIHALVFSHTSRSQILSIQFSWMNVTSWWIAVICLLMINTSMGMRHQSVRRHKTMEIFIDHCPHRRPGTYGLLFFLALASCDRLAAAKLCFAKFGLSWSS